MISSLGEKSIRFTDPDGRETYGSGWNILDFNWVFFNPSVKDAVKNFQEAQKFAGEVLQSLTPGSGVYDLFAAISKGEPPKGSSWGFLILGALGDIPGLTELKGLKIVKAFEKGAEVAGDVGKAGKAASKVPTTPKGTDFVVDPSGQAFPVPKGATGPTPVVNPAGKTTGSAFTGGAGGTNGQVGSMRMMDATPPRGSSPGYPNGYIKYENANGQGVNPYTGQTLPNSQSHYPIKVPE